MFKVLLGVVAALPVGLASSSLDGPRSFTAFIKFMDSLMAENPSLVFEYVSRLHASGDLGVYDDDDVLETDDDDDPALESSTSPNSLQGSTFAVRRPILGPIPGDGGLGGGGGEPPPGGGGGSGDDVDAVITAMAVQGEAPFTVHVHATESVVSIVDSLAASFEWDFDDPAGAYDQLPGWNAAHTFDTPGVYTVALTIDNGTNSDVATVNVTVTSSTRTVYYVAANGNDGNSGQSPSSPIRTIDRVKQLLDHDTEFRFRRGDTFPVSSTIFADRANVVLGAYGSGNRPTLEWSGPHEVQAILDMGDLTANATVEDIVFRSPWASASDVPRGIRPNGVNVTVRRCHFENLSDAMNAELVLDGWFTTSNTANELGTYFAWTVGDDIVHVGNDVGDSINEHNIRGRGNRILIHDNVLFNPGKSGFWLMEGSYGWASFNQIEASSIGVNPWALPQNAGDDKRFEFARIETNDLVNTVIRHNPGVHNLRIANNIIWDAQQIGIEIAGYDPDLQRTSSGVQIVSNTILYEGTSGQGLLISGPDLDGLFVFDNLYIAPNLTTGAGQSACVYIEQHPDDLPGLYVFAGNVWALPVERTWCDGVFYVWNYWSDCEGYRNEAEWLSLPIVGADTFYVSSFSDLDELGNPTFPTEAGARR